MEYPDFTLMKIADLRYHKHSRLRPGHHPEPAIHASHVGRDLIHGRHHSLCVLRFDQETGCG